MSGRGNRLGFWLQKPLKSSLSGCYYYYFFFPKAIVTTQTFCKTFRPQRGAEAILPTQTFSKKFRPLRGAEVFLPTETFTQVSSENRFPTERSTFEKLWVSPPNKFIFTKAIVTTQTFGKTFRPLRGAFEKLWVSPPN